MENLNAFISNALLKDKAIDTIIDARKSESTESYYFIIKTTDNTIYQLAFSDHAAGVHDKDIYDVVLDFDGDFDDMKEELNEATGIGDDFEMNVEDTDYFGVAEAVPYDVDAASLIGKHSVTRAFLSEDDVIKAAELTEDNRVMVVSYADETRTYVNFEPSEFAYDAEIALINYLIGEYDVHTARKYYYNDTISIEEGNELANDNETLYKYNGVDYVIDSSLLSLS